MGTEKSSMVTITISLATAKTLGTAIIAREMEIRKRAIENDGLRGHWTGYLNDVRSAIEEFSAAYSAARNSVDAIGRIERRVK